MSVDSEPTREELKKIISRVPGIMKLCANCSKEMSRYSLKAICKRCRREAKNG